VTSFNVATLRKAQQIRRQRYRRKVGRIVAVAGAAALLVFLLTVL
jgi:hypothetical protein